MQTCFLFIEHLTDNTCLSIILNDQGKIEAPLLARTFDDIKSVQATARTIVVLPCERCSLHRVELPWLNAQKARAALPYALEEQLAQSVANVHIAFDQQHYQNKHYLVVVIDKDYLLALIERLSTLTIEFDTITLDWFALRTDEACISETSLLAYDNDFQGALSTELASMFLTQRASDVPILMFNDSASSMKSTAFHSVDESFYEWVAKRLLATSPMNLCQGALQRTTSGKIGIRWYQACAALTSFSLIIFLVTYGFASYYLNAKNDRLDQDIATIYREFFPQAATVISPKFRVEQLLKSQRDVSSQTLWTLLDKLSAAMRNESLTIEQFQYDNQMLSVTLTSKDFATLEAFQLRLRKAQVKVIQAQASLHEQHALATLELRL